MPDCRSRRIACGPDHSLHASSQTNFTLDRSPSDIDIRKVIADRVDVFAGKEDGIGIVVGIIGPQGRRIISYGHLNQGDPRPLDGNTDFEIASVTKVFTALLLAEMVQTREVALADPVAKYLPARVKIPERNGHAITLLDLATHTSALPFMPDEMPAFGDSTAAKPSNADIYRYLAGYHLPRDPGADWDYSNTGYWLLGEALAHRGGMDFESLLRARVLAPLNLKDTAITPPGEAEGEPRRRPRRQFAAGPILLGRLDLCTHACRRGPCFDS